MPLHRRSQPLLEANIENRYQFYQIMPLFANDVKGLSCNASAPLVQHIVHALDNSLLSPHQLSDDVRADEACPAGG